MIRNALLGPLARIVRRSTGRGGVWLEPLLEYVLWILGWAVWPLDTMLRLPALAREASVGPAPRRIAVVAVALMRRGADGPAPGRIGRVLEEAGILLEPLRLSLEVESVRALAWPDEVPPPSCGPGAVLSRFFPWASARAHPSPRLTVYFVEDLGPLAGCAVPGSDWIVVDARTDGTTVAHELGHLADLWPHDADPDNLMTDRHGGAHARVTPFQAAMIRTSRFSVAFSGR